MNHLLRASVLVLSAVCGVAVALYVALGPTSGAAAARNPARAPMAHAPVAAMARALPAESPAPAASVAVRVPDGPPRPDLQPRVDRPAPVAPVREAPAPAVARQATVPAPLEPVAIPPRPDELSWRVEPPRPASAGPRPAVEVAQAVPLSPGEPSVPASVLMELLDRMLEQERPATAARLAGGGAAAPALVLPPPSTTLAAEAAPGATTTASPAAEPAPAPAETPGRTSIVANTDDPEGDGQLSISVQNEDIHRVLEALAVQGDLNLLASNSVEGKVSANLKGVDVETALDAILRSTGYTYRRDGNILFVGTPKDFETMAQAADRISTRVYRPNYVTAAELQALITPLLTPSIGKISVTSPSAVGITPDSGNAGGNSLSNEDALVVQDYERVLIDIDQVVNEIDQRPLQVAIEAVILSVDLNDSNTFGVDFQLLRDKQNIRFGWGQPRLAPLDGGGQIDPGTGARVGEFQFTGGGLKFAFLDSSLGVFINALETVGHTNVIARPRVLVLNKQRAEILIGQELGYISTTTTQTFATQTVEFLEVGAALRLRPFIADDGQVRLEVHPELSDGGVEVEGGFTLPSKTTTQVTTNIMCPDGRTVVIGGLMRDTLRTNINQVPVMGSLPVVGPLFRTKTENMIRQEVLVLLTPHIVSEPALADASELEEIEYLRRHDEKFLRMNPGTRLRLEREYVDRARAALDAGRPLAAWRFAQLALHYNPQSLDALRLRDLAEAARGRGGFAEGTADGPPVEGVIGPEALDGQELPAEVLEQLETPAGERADVYELPSPPLRDRGQQGRRLDLVRPEEFPRAAP